MKDDLLTSHLVNPYLPNWEYVPDGEPRVFGGRLYIFGSHDRFNGSKYCQNDYVGWSAPLDDLSAWTTHGVIYRREQDPMNRRGRRALWAPDVVRGADGRFYMYYGIEFEPRMGVAVAPTPEGPFEFMAHVVHGDGTRLGGRAGDPFPFDPGLLVDDDGRVFLYFGFAPTSRLLTGLINRKKLRHQGAYIVELDPVDMHTIVGDGPKLVAPMAGTADGTRFAGHEFFEAASMRKIDGIYHFIYSSIHGHELCYATGDRPDGPFEYQGVLVSNGDIGFDGRPPAAALNFTANTHGSLVELGGKWFVFYHRHTNSNQYSRQGCAERIERDAEGRFLQAEMTSAGLSDSVLPGVGTYSASIACNLRGPGGAGKVSGFPWTMKGKRPYLTQSGKDREALGDQYVANLRQGALVGFKYFDLRASRTLSVDASASGTGRMLVSTAIGGEPIAVVPVPPGKQPVPLRRGLGEHSALYFQYSGTGRVDFRSFTLR